MNRKLSAFLKGFTSVFDFSGIFSHIDYEFEKDDNIALCNDWQKIGYDFKSIIGDWNNYDK